METKQLSAGRELDALVAEKVFGLKIEHRYWPCGIEPECGRFELGPVYVSSSGPKPVKHYSTSIADAWKVVEKIRESVEYQTKTERYSFQLCQTGIPGGWYCSFTVNQYDFWHQEFAAEDGRSAPEAICLAAIKACEANT